MKKVLNGFILGVMMSGSLIAQNHCATSEVWEKMAAKDPDAFIRRAKFEDRIKAMGDPDLTNVKLHPDLQSKRTKVTITIPVVVHVVYRLAAENITDDQIISQLVVMNRDFRARNADSLISTHPFYTAADDPELEFCLAKVDPFGNPTTGITRSHTTTWSYDVSSNVDNVKSSTTGGADNWDPTRYLNIWVCNLVGGVLGYATFPSDVVAHPELDGIVLGYKYVGTTGAVTPPTVMGRTAIHETGHWLGLFHIWGDAACGDDMIADTKPAVDKNYGCPTFPHRPFGCTGSDGNGEMFMNYMDYSDDYCMSMFTHGQVTKMRTAIGDFRSAIFTQTACTSTAGIDDPENKVRFSVSPNPSDGPVTLYFGDLQPLYNKDLDISLTDNLGRIVWSMKCPFKDQIELPLGSVAKGLYHLKVQAGALSGTRKLIIAQ